MPAQLEFDRIIGAVGGQQHLSFPRSATPPGAALYEHFNRQTAFFPATASAMAFSSTFCRGRYMIKGAAPHHSNCALPTRRWSRRCARQRE
jgi:hypothetical protein